MKSKTREVSKYEIAKSILEMAGDILKKQKGNVSPKEYDNLQIQFDQTLLIANKIIKGEI
jgi:non-homologous end joining protein Ku